MNRVIGRLDGFVHDHEWHDKPLRRRFSRWVCYRFDLACGLTKAEARS